MHASDFDYQLPKELIAQTPLAERSASRLLVLPATASADCQDAQVSDLPKFLRKGDVLVVNNTKVIAARLFGHKATGGKVEVLLERVVGERQAWAHVKASKSPNIATALVFAKGIEATVADKQAGLSLLSFNRELDDVLSALGQLPLPPYIERAPTADDLARYQTVYAEVSGAVAAPTAGLHFTEALLAEIKALGVQIAEVTLHVGAGTFQPLRSDTVSEHVMHHEWLSVSAATVQLIEQAKVNGGRVMAVGTTVVRALESAALSGTLQPYTGDTNLFITPGFQFKVVDGLLTNFHLPKSTLLMLVCALRDRATVMQAYAHAVAKRYRFFSYGDAMFIPPAQ